MSFGIIHRMDTSNKPSAQQFRRGRFATEWFLLLGSLLVLGAFLAISLHRDRQAIEARERERLTTQATVIHDNLIRLLDGINRALVSVRADLPDWQRGASGPAQASQRLRAFSDALLGVRTMTVLDADGVVLAASRPELIGGRFGERAYFQAARRTAQPGTLYVSPPFRTSLGAWGINVVRVVPDTAGGFGGIVSATLDAGAFTTLLESVRYAADMRITLNHGDGAIFLTAPVDETLYGRNLAAPGSFHTRHIESGRDSSVLGGILLTTGVDSLAALRTLRHDELDMDKPLIVMVSRETDAIFAGWRRQLAGDATLFGFLLLSTCAGLAFFQSRRRRTEAAVERAERELQEKAAEIDRFFAVSIDLLAIADTGGRFVRLNPAWEQTLGYPLAELTGARFVDLIHPDDRAATAAAMEKLRNGERIIDFTNRYRASTGEYRHIQWHSVPIPGSDRIYAAARDVTESQRLQATLRTMNAQLQTQAEMLRAQAYLDGLTGIANRRRFDEALAAEWRRCQRDDTPLAVLMVDIDHFKRFNDRYGHQAGDEALCAVAAALRHGMGRPFDLAARYGGEEFVCLLPGSDFAGACTKAAQIRIAVEALGIPHDRSSVSDRVTVSIGVAACAPGPLEEAGTLLAAADEALYEAKHNGRNRVAGQSSLRAAGAVAPSPAA